MTKFGDARDKPGWACNRYGDYEHDWLECYECIEAYDRWIEEGNDGDEHSATGR